MTERPAGWETRKCGLASAHSDRIFPPLAR
jgi:hypothetical protein